jgi:hypothetical protein
MLNMMPVDYDLPVCQAQEVTKFPLIAQKAFPHVKTQNLSQKLQREGDR